MQTKYRRNSGNLNRFDSLLNVRIVIDKWENVINSVIK